MDFELRIFDKLSEYIDNCLTDSTNAAIRDDKLLFAALVQARAAHHARILYMAERSPLARAALARWEAK